jgi:transcriptional regulator with GAF, ATPase, and Fis domain
MSLDPFVGRGFDEIVGKSPALWTVLEQVERVAPTNSTLLIQGETGTGRGLITECPDDLGEERSIGKGGIPADSQAEG